MDKAFSFSQQQGLEPLPKPLALGELPLEVRNLLWTTIYFYVQKDKPQYYDIQGNAKWYGILYRLHVWHWKLPGDEFDPNFKAQCERLKGAIQKSPYNKVFDLVQFILRDPDCPLPLPDKIVSLFKSENIAYTILDKDTIIPSVSEEDGKTYLNAMKVTSEKFPGSRRHLKNSGEEVSKGNWANSIRESIHAVESVMKALVGDESADFRGAIGALSKKMEFHGALKAGFEKLYAYTNDEKGIRHSLLLSEANVDKHDAIFMLSSCSAFVTFLVNKAQNE